MPTYSAYTDQQLLPLVKAGDEEAFREVFERFLPLLHRFASRILRDDDEATDIVQDTFMVLWEKRATLDESGMLKSYLYTITRNRILEFLRRSKYKAQFFEELKKVYDEGVPSHEQQLFEKELADRIEAELASLPPKAREAFELRRIQEMSIKEIGQAMGISDTTVKHHIGRAIKSMKDKLANFIFLFL